MNTLLASVYARSPAAIQNAMTALYGYRLHYQRYGGNFGSYLREAREIAGWPRERLEALQNERIRAIVRHAYEHTRYYRELFDRLQISPADIRTKADLCKLPVLTKSELRRHGAALLADNIPRSRIFIDHTSGTTGTPVTLYIDYDCLRYNYALFVRHREAVGVGINARPRRASLRGRVIVPADRDRPPFWRYNPAEGQVMLSSFHLSPGNIPAYVAMLAAFRPDVLEGYPSSIYTLALEMRRQGLSGIYPAAVFTDAEKVLAYQRECIEKQFRCRLYDQYGSSELVTWVSQCREGKYHIAMDFGCLEILNDGAPAPCGQEGNIVCTGLRNYAMPLLRYAIGDRGALSPGICSCGSALPVLASVDGRVEDTVVTPQGRRVGRLDSVFKSVSHVAEAQIVQDTVNEIRVNIVRQDGFRDSDACMITAALKERLGAGMECRLHFVRSIERGSNGKFRFVVSRLQGTAGM